MLGVVVRWVITQFILSTDRIILILPYRLGKSIHIFIQDILYSGMHAVRLSGFVIASYGICPGKHFLIIILDVNV